MTTEETAGGEIVWGTKLCVLTFKPSFVVAEPIPVTLWMKNNGESAVHVELRDEWDDFEYHLDLDEDCLALGGKSVPLTRFGHHMTAGAMSERCIGRMLEPGRELRWEITLNRYFDMTTSGVYLLTASRPISQWDNDSSSAITRPITSNTLKLELTEE